MTCSKSILIIFFILLSNFSVQVLSVVEDCGAEEDDGCTNKKKALPLKIIAIVTILISSIIGVCLPLVTQSIPALSPERSLFVIVKAFASGIILATGFMHVLPDSFDMLSSTCLKENPWHKFPFTLASCQAEVRQQPEELAVVEAGGSGHSHFHGHHHGAKMEVQGSQLLRYRVIAMVST
ncbi:hypothetical protein MIMGU_mgv1a019346mg [Erythranthe guttata]|uniref:Uncharacterized protein n=1 Tax=Erythranthe guttata TaxID=4155 RepID=A0A022QHS7_ERYGU|nr:hypothetical protein MIMGU_mgv1a019346mg [Erythranthe guttata]